MWRRRTRFRTPVPPRIRTRPGAARAGAALGSPRHSSTRRATARLVIRLTSRRRPGTRRMGDSRAVAAREPSNAPGRSPADESRGRAAPTLERVRKRAWTRLIQLPNAWRVLERFDIDRGMRGEAAFTMLETRPRELEARWRARAELLRVRQRPRSRTHSRVRAQPGELRHSAHSLPTRGASRQRSRRSRIAFAHWRSSKTQVDSGLGRERTRARLRSRSSRLPRVQWEESGRELPL